MLKNRIYIFDWDDNILHMPTKIVLKKKSDSGYVDMELSTSEYALIRGSNEYILDSNSLMRFDDDSYFLPDVKEALKDFKNLGPSYEKFKECLLYGHNFAIITGRGHSPNTIITGIHELLTKTFTTEELITIGHNIIKKHGGLVHYFNNQKIYPVMSKMFYNDFNLCEDCSIEQRKTMALEKFLVERLNYNNEFDISAKISVGFSDDDKKNINLMENFIKNSLKNTHPNIHFVIYDTSNRNNIIKKSL